jgi:predicted aspartyl protease
VGIKLDDSFVTLAVLDTGADWSVIQTEVAKALGLLERDGEPKTMTSRLGKHHGKLVRVNAELVAEEGESVQLDSTVFVCEDWPAGTFVGYHGLLERVRFAVDPEQNAFLFGMPDDPLQL